MQDGFTSAMFARVVSVGFRGQRIHHSKYTLCKANAMETLSADYARFLTSIKSI
jgi:hypothetical protein